MSKSQSRRGVSLSRTTYAATVAFAARENVSLSELVTRGLRLAGVDIPEQAHRTRAEAEHAVACRIEAAHAPPRPKPLPLAKGPAPRAANAVPSADDLAALLRSCRRGVSNIYSSDLDVRAAAERRVSIRFAHELRKRGWLLPENEGAAPGSWWTPGGEKRKAS